MNYVLIALAFVLTSCTVTRVDTGKIEPKQFGEAVLPLDASIQIYIPGDELRELFVFVDGFGKRTVIETGEDLKNAATDIAAKYFVTSDKLTLGKPTHYVLRLKGDTDLNTFWGTYKATLEATLLDHTGRVVDVRQVKGSSTSGVLNDVNAYFNAYVQAARKYFDVLFEDLGSEIVAFTQTNPARSFAVDDISSVEAIKPVSSGTGFIINSSGQVLTNSHVVTECIGITITNAGTEESADMVLNDYDSDIAVLSSSRTGEVFAEFAAMGNDTRLGAQVLTVGYPLPDLLSEEVSLTIGNVSSLSGLKNDESVLQFSAPVQPGNSGGPLLGTDGLVYGVVQSKLNALSLATYTGDIAQNVNFAIKKDGVLKVLDDNQLEYTVRDAAESASLEIPDIGDVASDYTLQILCYG